MQNQEEIWANLYKKGLSWKKETLGIKDMLNRKSVLELGAGNGKTLKSILKQKPKKIVAIDISNEALSKIKEDNISLVNIDFLKFKTSEKFDAIICYYFLNNFNEKQRNEVVLKIKSMLKKKGIILFEDFSEGDFRQKGKEIEKNTIEKSNGLICHFFNKKEIEKLFRGFELNITQRQIRPIRKDKLVQRKIITAVIRTR